MFAQATLENETAGTQLGGVFNPANWKNISQIGSFP